VAAECGPLSQLDDAASVRHALARRNIIVVYFPPLRTSSAHLLWMARLEVAVASTFSLLTGMMRIGREKRVAHVLAMRRHAQLHRQLLVSQVGREAYLRESRNRGAGHVGGCRWSVDAGC
jgi:uncharacterized membrane protein YozB (DUF420 family)